MNQNKPYRVINITPRRIELFATGPNDAQEFFKTEENRQRLKAMLIEIDRECELLMCNSCRNPAATADVE